MSTNQIEQQQQQQQQRRVLVEDEINHSTPFTNSSFLLVPHNPSHPDPSHSFNMHYRVWTRDEFVKPYRFCLLIHDFAASTFSWRNQIDSLLEKHDIVVAADLPGFGYSGRETDVILHISIRRAHCFYYLCKYIEQLYSCSESNKELCKYWTLMGHGMGAKVVTALAHVWREKEGNNSSSSQVLNIVLVSPESYELEENRNLQNKLIGWIPGVLSATILRWVLLRPSFIRYMLNNYCYNRVASQEEVNHYSNPLIISGTAESIVEMNQSSCLEDKTCVDMKELNRFATRLMIICGDGDRIIPIEDHVKLYSLLQHDEIEQKKEYKVKHDPVKLHVVEGSGHNLMETHSQDFNSIVEEFCEFPASTANRNTGRFFSKLSGLVKQFV